MARDEKVMIRLHTDVKNKVQENAERLGLSMSSYIAFIVGQFIDQQERVVKPMTGQMADAMMEIMKRQIESQSR